MCSLVEAKFSSVLTLDARTRTSSSFSFYRVSLLALKLGVGDARYAVLTLNVLPCVFLILLTSSFWMSVPTSFFRLLKDPKLYGVTYCGERLFSSENSKLDRSLLLPVLPLLITNEAYSVFGFTGLPWKTPRSVRRPVTFRSLMLLFRVGRMAARNDRLSVVGLDDTLWVVGLVTANWLAKFLSSFSFSLASDESVLCQIRLLGSKSMLEYRRFEGP